MNPWAIVGALLVWIATLAGVGYWQNGAGHTAERLVWQERANQELDEANRKIIDLNDKYRSAEQAHTVALDALAVTYEGKLKNANQKTAALVRAAGDGAFRLRDPHAAACPPGGSNLPETAAGAGQRDGAGDGGLSTVATQFLLELTGRCNAVRDKLTTCQAIVIEDRNEAAAH